LMNAAEVVCTMSSTEDQLFVIRQVPQCDSVTGKMEFWKYSLKSREWSTHEVELKQNEEERKGTEINGMFALKETNEICLITNAFVAQNSANRYHREVVHAIFYDADMTRVVSTSQLLMTRSDVLLSCCMAEERYICVYIYNPFDVPLARHECQRFLVKDTKGRQTKGFQDFSKGCFKGNVIFPVGQEIYVCDFERASNQHVGKFDLKKRRWSTFEANSLLSLQREMCGLGTIDDKVYAIGGDDMNRVVEKCDRYDMGRKEWAPIASLPRPLYCMSVQPAQISCEFLTCHADCPHCKLTAETEAASEGPVFVDTDDTESEEGNCVVM